MYKSAHSTTLHNTFHTSKTSSVRSVQEKTTSSKSQKFWDVDITADTHSIRSLVFLATQKLKVLNFSQCDHYTVRNAAERKLSFLQKLFKLGLLTKTSHFIFRAYAMWTFEFCTRYTFALSIKFCDIVTRFFSFKINFKNLLALTFCSSCLSY